MRWQRRLPRRATYQTVMRVRADSCVGIVLTNWLPVNCLAQKKEEAGGGGGKCV